MSQKQPTTLPLISRDDEERNLSETLSIVRSNAESYGEQVRQMQADIDEMLERFHDNDVEVLTLLNNTVTLHEHMKLALERNQRALTKPYFGRIIFHDETLNRQESLYIGRGGISKDTIHPVVIDWRAPVANAYYENNLGKCSYAAPGGEDMPIDLELKRTYEIENGSLVDYFDSEVIANDELLTKYLAKNKQAVLGEIVATIQKEQNDIIRLTPYHNLIVQGVAGSGKTTVAMHRISYILYNYAKRFKPEDFYIVGSNRILLNYITGVLPELDVHGVRQMTMEQLFVRLLYEQWDEKNYRIRTGGAHGNKRGNVRGSLGWFRELKEYLDRMEWKLIPRETVCLTPVDSIEPATLLPRETIERYIRQNPAISLQSKIDALNERAVNKVQDYFLEHIGRYTADEKKEMLRPYRRFFGGRKLKQTVYDIYFDFLDEMIGKGYDVEFPEETAMPQDNSTASGVLNSSNSPGAAPGTSYVTELDVYDLAALAYIYARVIETEVISEAHHIVIDEAQDFGMMAYSALNFCIRSCTYTIMGDVSQNIHFGSGLNDWEELKRLILQNPDDNFRVLKKSYRNTVEISEFAIRILHHGKFSVYPVEPIIRHGDPVQVISLTNKGRDLSAFNEHMIKKAASVLTAWQKQGYDTIAVVCRDMESAAVTAARLGKYVNVIGENLEEAVFSNGIMVLPVEFTKGLEFDAVLILNPTREDYPVDDGHAKLLYVAATRALHQLCILHTDDLTGLIADEPEYKTLNLVEDKTETSRTSAVMTNAASAAQTPEKPRSLFFSSGKALDLPDKTDADRILDQARQADRSVTGMKSKSILGTAGQATLSYRQVPTNTNDSSGNAARPAAANNKTSAKPKFGDIPADSILQPPGHSKIDLAIRWVSRQPDGLYLQSRYGVLRLSPINSRIIRVSFAKIGQLIAEPNSRISVKQVTKEWMYRELNGGVELMTDDICLRIEKSTGAIQYMTRDKKPLLAEQPKDCRQLEPSGDVSLSTWLYLNWTKKEQLQSGSLNLRGAACYLSGNKEAAPPLPLIISDKGYGLLIASKGPVIFCDKPQYGSYIHTQRASQMDFYFLVGNAERIMNDCENLCTR